MVCVSVLACLTCQNFYFVDQIRLLFLGIDNGNQTDPVTNVNDNMGCFLISFDIGWIQYRTL